MNKKTYFKKHSKHRFKKRYGRELDKDFYILLRRLVENPEFNHPEWSANLVRQQSLRVDVFLFKNKKTKEKIYCCYDNIRKEFITFLKEWMVVNNIINNYQTKQPVSKKKEVDGLRTLSGEIINTHL